jgi:hypothetical protein
MEKEECQRIVKEFDYKFYGKRLKVEPGQVFACLFGGIKADSMVLKTGMQRMKYSN